MRMRRLNRLKVLTFICDYWPEPRDFKNDTFETASMYDTIVDMAPSLFETMHSCEWLGKDYYHRYDKLFAPIITDEGLCSAFNALNSADVYTKK